MVVERTCPWRVAAAALRLPRPVCLPVPSQLFLKVSVTFLFGKYLIERQDDCSPPEAFGYVQQARQIVCGSHKFHPRGEGEGLLIFRLCFDALSGGM